MGRLGNCHDNALAKKFFNRLKRKVIMREVYKTRSRAWQDVCEYIEMFYNPKWKRVWNGMLSTVDFERQQKFSSEGV